MKYIIFLFISFSSLFADAHIFVYHRFGDDRYPSTNTTMQQLKEQFEYFKKNQYEVVSIEKIVKKVQAKEKVPNHWVGLAIDDAYKSFYDNALPMFKEYNYPFTLYVYVEATEKRYKDFMTWDQLNEASKYGSLGLHSYGHKRMTRLSSQEIFEDVKKAYDIFTKRTGSQPKTYVHPYGEYDKHVLHELKKFHFDAIFNQNSGSINTNSDLNDLNRIAIVGKVNLKRLFRYKTLDAQWEKPQVFPKDGILKEVKASVDPKYKNLKLFITGSGWRDIKVNNGQVHETLNVYLKNSRTRLILSPDYYTVSNQLIIK